LIIQECVQDVNLMNGKMKKEEKYTDRELQDKILNMLFKENCELKIQNNNLTEIIKYMLKEKYEMQKV
jgi:hypothetical protein